MLMIISSIVVAFCYFGGSNCPSLLRQNKEMLLGVLVGMTLCSFTGLRMEGLPSPGGGDMESMLHCMQSRQISNVQDPVKRRRLFMDCLRDYSDGRERANKLDNISRRTGPFAPTLVSSGTGY